MSPKTHHYHYRPLAVSVLFALLAALFLAAPVSAEGSDPDPEPEPEALHLTIMEIQGTGHLSPYVGETVSAFGVVTAVAFRGFYMQHPWGDRDSATSDGIFVSSRADVEVGNKV
ncbi:MAG: hypothetical protein ACE5GE_16615, partial [Phycisphaerae bacterium]